MKYSFQIILIIVLLSVISLNTVALNKVPQSITDKAKATIGDFTSALESQKQGYGIAENEIVKDRITLADGYEVSNISDNVLKQDGAKNNDEILKNTNTYAFPIKLGNKCVGIAFADNAGVFQVSSYTEFESDIENAKNIVKNELKSKDLSNESDVKFIFDQRFGFTGLSMKASDGDYLIPLKDNPFEDIKKLVKKLSKEDPIIFKKVIDERKSSNGTIAGAGGSTNDITRNQLESSFKSIYVVISVILALTLVGFFMSRRKLVRE